MVFYKDGTWHICTERVKYIQHGETITQYVGSEGHDWWVDFADKWEHTEIVEFIPVEPTDEQLQKLEEVNSLNIPDGYGELVQNYVINNKFPEGLNHPLRELQLQKLNEQLELALIETTVLLANEQIKNTQNEQAILELSMLLAGGAE